jgi:hypothetical protein
MRYLVSLFLFAVLFSCKEDNDPPKTNTVLQLSSLKAGSLSLNTSDASKNQDVPVNATIEATFTSAVDPASVEESITLLKGPDPVEISFDYSDDAKTVTIIPDEKMAYLFNYSLVIDKTLTAIDGSVFPGITVGFKTKDGSDLQLVSFKVDGINGTNTRLQDVALDPVIELKFSVPVNTANLTDAIDVRNAKVEIPFEVEVIDETTIHIKPVNSLHGTERHSVALTSMIEGAQAETFSPVYKYFFTADDPDPVLPVISDNELLTLVQQRTFKYFWDFAHPDAGLARERNTSGDIVTTGGSGFGLMALVVGIDRGFITRSEGVARFNKIVTFLENADRFHGAWPHWINGKTGDVVPFGTKDNGGDLVETSFLVQGLITVRQYLNGADTVGNNLIRRITKLSDAVEWSWYRKDNQNVLYWHWSPNYEWQMNFAMYGYFEEQITYVLAAGATTYSIPKSVYTGGYGNNGAIVTNNVYYDYNLPLGGLAPLFWTQYSYLGMDPHFSDGYADYWEQNTNASLINRAYCIANPKNYPGYSEKCWGLTSSDNQDGYDAHSPGNDLGVITPTAALSAFAYTPEESMTALKFFYYNLGDRIWGEYGFYDAFNINEAWYADSYLAIDQGPIVVMIENYRTGLLWDLFMSSPEMTKAKTVLDLNVE